MIFNTDSYYSIGSTHTVCQDFSLAKLISYNIENDAAVALVSDGCSKSINSEIGAMLISKCAESRLKYYFPEEKSFRLKLLDQADHCCDLLNLDKKCLDATLLFVQADFNSYEIRAYGDGSILKLNHDGTVEFIFIEYLSGAPLYPNYYLDTERFERYKSFFGLKRKISKFIITTTSIDLISSEIDELEDPYIEYGDNKYKAIMVTSDGIASFGKFTNKIIEPLDTVDIIREIMNNKSFKGEFIQRAMNGLKKYCEKNSIKHTDDFSIAGISFE